jgi:NTP pyrophosphatase (non-canonical NTP hydrolase)
LTATSRPQSAAEIGMDIKQLTDGMNKFVEAKGWYRPDSRAPQTPRNIATSLAIEAAEVLEHFQWNDTARHPGELAGELADVALYLLQLAYLTDIDLEQAILDKLAVNYNRTWPEDEV